MNWPLSSAGHSVHSANVSANGSAAPRERAEPFRLAAPAADRHVLIPVGLEPYRRPGALLALEVAAAYRPGAQVTLLHVVVPEPEPTTFSFHWGSAIEQLHR